MTRRKAIIAAAAVAALLLIAHGGAASAEQLTKPPKLIHFVDAVHPESESTRTATVVLAIDIDARGQVSKVEVAESAGGAFDRAAIEAARQFVFEPAEIDGKATPVRILYAYRFTEKTELVPLGPQVNFEGVIEERFSKRPLAGVRVELAGTHTATLTGSDGAFRFEDVPLGTHTVVVSGANLISVSTEETFAEHERTSVVYLVEEKEEGVDEETIVRAARIRRDAAQVTIATEEARRIPGTQGDTLKVLQNLPGVARSALGSGEIVVWGSAPRDTRIYVDGVEIPVLYHLGGLRSTINSDLVKSVELVPGAYGAEHGRGLGGLVSVETKPLPTEGIHGYAGADALDASALVSAALGDLRIAAAGRYSYLDRLLSGIVAPDIGDIFPIPRYDDYQLKASLRLREGEDVSLFAMGSNDRLRRTIDSRDPNARRSERVDLDFYRASLRYTRILDSGASFAVVPSIGWDDAERRSTFGRVPADLSIASLRYGLRASYRERITSFATISMGADVLGTRSHVMRSGSITLPPREGDVTVFGQAPGDDINSDDFHIEIVDVAPYVHAELALGPLTISPGLRLDAFLLDGDRLSPPSPGAPTIGFSRMSPTIEPRIAARLRLTDEIGVSAAAGSYHQAPEPEELSAVFGTPTLGLAQGIHASLGATVRFTRSLSLDTIAFYKHLSDLVTRSRMPTPLAAQALAQAGTGQSYGAQVLLRQQMAEGVFGWLSYAISRSERQDAPDAQVRLFDFDQTHVLAVVASWEIGDWVLSGRVRYATGYPRTPVTGALYDARDDQFQPIFGAQNSIRIPAFFQADLRAEYAIPLDAATLRIYVDLENVTYRKNPEEIIYNHDYSTRSYITGLPFLAVVGARVEI
jgi:TonB family protein